MIISFGLLRRRMISLEIFVFIVLTRLTILISEFWNKQVGDVMSGDNVEFYGKFCIEVSPIPNFIVIFGASGDLTHRKLIPALFNLFKKKMFHEKSRIIGCARSEMNDESYRTEIRKALLEKEENKKNQDVLDEFIKRIHYISGDYDDPKTYKSLSKEIETVEKEVNMVSGRLFYLSTPSTLYSPIIAQLHKAGMVHENVDGIPWRNVVIEKPFGKDLQSARKLDHEIRGVLKERQIYRIDHYLGKETVQNILMLRFANVMFEPVWNNRYIDNVQITVAESIGVESRAGYYDSAGLLRDMFQNHMLEMLSLVAMEPPASFEANRVRDEKAKLLSSIRPFDIKNLSNEIVRAQYVKGNASGIDIKGYREEEGIAPNSNTETYVASKMLIDNWRWHGVPFYLRSGKRLPKRVSEIVITFKKIPHSIFTPIRAEDLSANTLTLNVQPEEGVKLSIEAKQPGPKLCMGTLSLDFKYSEIFGGSPPDAYERLLLDAMLGDQTLFIRSDTIDMAWTLLTPVLDSWHEKKLKKGVGDLAFYPAGSWGPEEADRLIQNDGKRWKMPT